MANIRAISRRRSIYLMLKSLALAAALTLIGGAGYLLFGRSATTNFEVVVTLAVDGRTISGSSVWQTTVRPLFNPLGNSIPYNTETRGEAIAIPISESLVAFALLRPAGSNLADAQYGDLILDCGVVAPADIAVFKGGCEVVDRPELLLADIVEGVPVMPHFQSLATYGATEHTIELVDVSVEVTNEEITTGLAERFPWILSLPDGYSIGKFTGQRRQLFNYGVTYQADFVRGTN
ncbi:MAG: hypothetical protein ACO1OG_08175 [Devosia sp.]